MANEGEERLATLYADIHYWFAQPSARPASHRFDKECYVYLYRDTSTNRGRLEVANHAGTAEQDAFEGYLDNAKITQSSKQPTLVTVEVDGSKGQSQVAAQNTEWRLPSTDPRDEGKYLFRLHTLDIYFWTNEDANLFAQGCEHILRPQQLHIDRPVEENTHSVASPVVEKLENLAVTDPAYNNHGINTTKGTKSPIPTGRESASPLTTQGAKTSATDYTPLAYNPATPAAPEKRAHREKTPPPPEEPGVGLTHAASETHLSSHQPYTGVPASSQHSYSPAPSSHGYSSPPPTSTPQTSLSHGPPRSSLSKVGSNQPLDSPTAQILGSNYLTSSTAPLQHIQPQYADYLAQHQSTQSYQPSHYYPTSTGDTDIHSQVYIPEEGESHGKASKKPKPGSDAPGAGKWEQKAEKAEKGLNRLLRKVEKKIG